MKNYGKVEDPVYPIGSRPKHLIDNPTVDEVFLGRNVLVFKVINEKNNWQGCARFRKDGAGVKTIRISLR